MNHIDWKSFASTVLCHVKWEKMEVHRLNVNNIAEWECVEQQKGLEMWVNWSVVYICYIIQWLSCKQYFRNA
jgi:hypothetical protein